MSDIGFCNGHRLGIIPATLDRRDWTAKKLYGRTVSAKHDKASVFEAFKTIRNQGSIGSCGPHSAWWNIGLLATTRGAQRNASPLFVYWVARYLMGTLGQDSGVDNRALLKALCKFGACDETLWPYDTDKMNDKPPRAAFQEALQWQLKDGGYARLSGVDEACGVIDVIRRGVIVAIPVYESFESKEAMKTGVVPMPDPARERLLGYHDMAGVAYDKVRGVFTCANSWGPDVGDNGLFHLPMAYPFEEFWSVEASELGTDDPKMNLTWVEYITRKMKGMA